VKSQRIFQYAFFFHRFTVKPQKRAFFLTLAKECLKS
jgi:hypothetical protein